MKNVKMNKTVSALLIALMIAACGGESPDKLIASSKEYLAKNDSKAAVIQLKNALQQNPNLGEARFLLGSALLDSGDLSGAEVELRKALELKHPADAVVPLLARAMLSLGQAKKLVDEFGKTALASGEPQAALKTTLATAYAGLGKADLLREQHPPFLAVGRLGAAELRAQQRNAAPDQPARQSVQQEQVGAVGKGAPRGYRLAGGGINAVDDADARHGAIDLELAMEIVEQQAQEAQCAAQRALKRVGMDQRVTQQREAARPHAPAVEPEELVVDVLRDAMPEQAIGGG